MGKVERKLVFSLIYRDGKDGHVYAKRFNMPKFILEKEYRLFDEHQRSRIMLLLVGEDKFARISLMPSSRAKTNALEISFNDYLIKGPSARGKRISNRPVRRVVESTGRSIIQEKQNLVLPGLASKSEEEAPESEPPEESTEKDA
jgi:topoisomerase-4 subunit A